MKINSVKYLYHGTNREFDVFDFGKAKRFKDFGRGFYLTTNLRQAQKWAQTRANEEDRAYIYRFSLDHVSADEWRVFELLQYDKEWLDFIYQCRVNCKEYDYDIVYDRMADSRVKEISDYLKAYGGEKGMADEIIKKIKWGDAYAADQYCFKTEKSLSLLKDRKIIVLVKDENQRWKILESKR